MIPTPVSGGRRAHDACSVRASARTGPAQRASPTGSAALLKVAFGGGLGRLAAAGMLAGILGNPGRAAAMLYLQEGFNYPAGTLANNSPWTDSTGLIVVTNTSLTYSNLADFSPPGQACAVNAGSTAVSYRPISAVTNGVVYYSFLLNFATKPGSYYIGGLLQATNAPPGGSAADPLDLIDISSGSGYKLGIRARGSGVTYAGTVLSLTNTYGVVLKYNFTNGLAGLYLNPAPGGAEPASADASASATALVPDLSFLYLRSGSSTAGNYLISTLRVGSTWGDVTPAMAAPNGLLAFAAQPGPTIAGQALTATVQLESAPGVPLASNNVPVTLSASGGSFGGGVTTAYTDPTGLASFGGLILTNSGSFTLNASAAGYNSALSTNFTILPAGIDHYNIAAPATALVGVPFLVTGTASDVYGNIVTTDDSTVVTLGGSTTNVLFDADGDGTYDESAVALAAGGLAVKAVDNSAEAVFLTVTDAQGHGGTSGLINVYSNSITAQGYMLNAFLDSLEVNKYWLVGTSVNWLTGAAGGSGANMTAGTASHCSAFAGAVTELLGVYLLRQPDASDLDLANHQAVWFVTNTAGWFPVTTMTNAQQLANSGVLVMASYQATSGSGHIAVLRASNRTSADILATGPEECQSGDYNFADTNIVTGFNQHPGAFPNGIKYYGHAVSYPISPITAGLGQPQVAGGALQGTAATIVGRSYQVQGSTNLLAWTTVVSATNSQAPLTFFTTNTFGDAIGGNARRFYRVVIP